jgi:ATP-dependent helicase HrpB
MARRWVALVEAARQAQRVPTTASGGGEESVGAILALAYPDRIAKNRGGGTGSFLLVNGRGGMIDPASPLAREAFLAVGELIGAAAASRIVLAAPITLAEIEARFAKQIEEREQVSFDPGSASLRVRRTRRLGALVLSEQTRPVMPDADTAHILAQGLIGLGIDRLPWSKTARQFRQRVGFLRRAEGDEWPDLSGQGLAASAAEWLEPLLMDKTTLSALSAGALSDAIVDLVPWNLRRRLDTEAPTHITAPSGSAVPIDYNAEQGPTVSIRVQELFGLATHPAIAGGRVPLVVELLSPAQRPVQVTRDLPGFWRGSYAAVRAEMRGRYPKHPWPDDPLTAPATRRAKRHGE